MYKNISFEKDLTVRLSSQQVYARRYLNNWWSQSLIAYNLKKIIGPELIRIMVWSTQLIKLTCSREDPPIPIRVKEFNRIQGSSEEFWIIQRNSLHIISNSSHSFLFLVMFLLRLIHEPKVRMWNEIYSTKCEQLWEKKKRRWSIMMRFSF